MNEESKENIEEKAGSSVNPKEKNYAGAIIATLLSGIAIGVVTGLLIAPKKGEKIRKEIKDKSIELIDTSKKTITDTIDKTKEFTKESVGKFEKIKKIIAPKKNSKQKKIDKEVEEFL